MNAINGRLAELVRRLDTVGPAPSLVDLAQAMNATRLERADVEPFVQANPHTYNRAMVVTGEHYELLVMTWLAGQASVPHDHAGSICVMQVVEGEAVEGSYRTAADGYVDLDYETSVCAGEVTSGQDAGVHTVRNGTPNAQMLITVHVYSPPLKNFRRFVPRPGQENAGSTTIVESTPTIVIVGGGFSGSMTAAHALKRARESRSPLRVVLIERGGSVGEGLAYATRDLVHLLNVPAGRMSAWPDQPDDFVRWASSRYGPIAPQEFVPRQWYGEYVRETLLETAREAAPWATLTVLFDEVRRIARRPSKGWMVHLATGASLNSDAVVLAIGHRPPSDPILKKWNGSRTRFIADPWRPFAMNPVKDGDSVVILGSGLTAVDAVLSLNSRGKNAITLVSRNGLLPQAHAAKPLPPVDVQSMIAQLTGDSTTALHVLRVLRRTVRQLSQAGGDWRSVVDALRPHTARLWQALPTVERRKFLTRLRPFWEVHRHRMAVAVAEKFNALRASGAVRTLAARVVSVQAEGDQVRLALGERKTNRLVELHADWVINCTGPAPSNSAAANPAIGSLLVQGYLRPDELGLGIETSADGHALDAQGREVADLLIVGTLRKPATWESTAVPELRQQAATAGQRAFELVAQPARVPRRPNFVWVQMGMRR